jgi:hypothetical protein
MTTECRCKRVKHEHGTYLMYNADRCRCPLCLEAKLVKQREQRRRVAALRWSAGRASILRDATGTRRRLQALAAIGWSYAAVGRELGMSKRSVAFLHTYQSVSDATAERVAAVYDRLWDKPRHGQAAQQTRNLAADRGWVPPMAWDDEDLDDPAACHSMPAGGPWDLNPCGTPAAARRHYRRGEPLCEACKGASKRDSVERRARKVAA